MNTKLLVVIIGISFYRVTAYAQQSNDSFNNYRKELLGRYSNHRENVLDEYTKYLKGVWKEYQSFRGVKSDITPKPSIQPKVSPNQKNEQPINLQPEIPLRIKSNINLPSIPEPTYTIPLNKTFQITFYDLELDIPQINGISSFSSSSLTKVATYWEELLKIDSCHDFLSGIEAIAAAHRFNDWLKIDLVRHSINKILKDTNTETRIIVTHYLLIRLGYNARLGITESKQWILLLPFQQQVFGLTFIQPDNKKYYVYYDSLNGHEESSPAITTCEIPESASFGKDVDLVFNHSLDLPKSTMHYFKITDGRLSIEGNISQSLIKLIAHYPQMPIPYYANSVLQKELRNNIVEQLKLQIKGLNELDAINTLLAFVQNAFKYATDEQQFGYEKPFFLEEILYYPKCDCEDRSIFYTYLLQNVLGIDCHLLNFPGHESVAVKLSHPINGTGYVFEGEHYYISDPTYIGAVTGMCMPTYQNMQPKIEK